MGDAHVLHADRRGRRRSALGCVRWPATVVVFGVLPVLVLVGLFTAAVEADAVAKDFRGFYRAAELMLQRESPYIAVGDDAAGVNGSYVYPPVTAVGVTPLTLLPREVAGFAAMALLVLVLLAVPWVLGVRDWRCYGLALMWPPAIAAIQTASVTIVLALGAALAWRFRDRLLASSLSAGAGVAMKLILWPLVVWLGATRRLPAAALSCVVGVGLALGTWAVIGFAGLAQYPALLQWLRETVELDSYTLYVMALDAGASPLVARALWLLAGVCLIGAVIRVGRRGDDRSAFVLAIAAALALSPIVWLHYFTLLLVVVCVAQPRLGAAWLAPLAMYVSTGSGNPTPAQTVTTILAATLTVALALAATRAAHAPRSGDQAHHWRRRAPRALRVDA